MSTGKCLQKHILIWHSSATAVRYILSSIDSVGIEHTTGESLNPYLAATTVTKQPIQEEQPMATTPIAPSDSDSDSN